MVFNATFNNISVLSQRVIMISFIDIGGDCDHILTYVYYMLTTF